MQCQFCSRMFSTKSGFTKHTRSCLLNSDRIPGYWESEEYKNKISIKRREQPPMSDETKRKISEKIKIRNNAPGYKELQSARMKKAVLENPESYSDNNIVGRSKHFTVDGVRYNSSWEYIVSAFMNNYKIQWQRSNIKPIPYEWNGKWHLYFPDFYLVDFDIYIEVKGYETDRDRCKWSYCDRPVLVIREKDIDLIKRNQYNLFDILSSYSQVVKAPAS